MLKWISDISKPKNIVVDNFSSSFEDFRAFSAILDAVDSTFNYGEVLSLSPALFRLNPYLVTFVNIIVFADVLSSNSPQGVDKRSRLQYALSQAENVLQLPPAIALLGLLFSHIASYSPILLLSSTFFFSHGNTDVFTQSWTISWMRGPSQYGAHSSQKSSAIPITSCTSCRPSI